MKLIKGILAKIKTKNGDSLLLRIKFIGLKNTMHSWFFQRVLRINSHVPWPVVPSSNVFYADRIIKEGNGTNRKMMPYVGYQTGSYFQGMNGIVLGDNIRFGPGVRIISANHDILNFDSHVKSDPIRIGNRCWIGANSVILPGVCLGEHVIVGAGSVVTKSFNGPDIMIAGVPADKVRDIGKYQGSPRRMFK